jgi:hypothetical protein
LDDSYTPFRRVFHELLRVHRPKMESYHILRQCLRPNRQSMCCQ